MLPRRSPAQFVADTSAVIRIDERVVLLLLVLLSAAALIVFLHYTVEILDGLPDVIPPEPPTLISRSRHL